MTQATTKARTKAKQTQTRAKQTTKQARETAKAAERTLESALRDAGYATLGAGDAAVEFVRNIGKVSSHLPERIKETPELLTDFFDQVSTNLREGYDDLADRGRQVTGSVKRSRKVSEAGDQIETARRQVKAAGTSVGRAAGAQAKATRTAVEKVGKPKPARKTSTTRSQSSAGSTSSTGTGPLGDRTVEELYERANELDIEGRSQMNKDELIKAIRSKS